MNVKKIISQSIIVLAFLSLNFIALDKGSELLSKQSGTANNIGLLLLMTALVVDVGAIGYGIGKIK